MGKLLKCHLKGKTCRKLANGQDIDYSEKKNGPRASSAPILGLFSLIFKQVSVYRTIGPLVFRTVVSKMHYLFFKKVMLLSLTSK